MGVRELGEKFNCNKMQNSRNLFSPYIAVIFLVPGYLQAVESVSTRKSTKSCTTGTPLLVQKIFFLWVLS